MRIGLVCPYSFTVPGGVQNQVLGLAAALTTAGHEVFVLGPGCPPAGTDLHGFDPARVTSTGSALAVRFNGSVARIGMGPLTASRVRRWLREVRLDIVHIHEPITPSAGLLALRAARAPVVATFHADVPDSGLLRVAGRLLARDIARIAATTAVSETAAAVVTRNWGVQPRIVPNAVFCGDFAAPDAAGWRGGAGPRITFLGRLAEPRKGLQTLLAAVPEIRRRVPGADIVVAGAGNVTLPPQVNALGALSDSARNRLLAATDIFVAPNLGGESFGLILVEALAAGARVVASDIPAFRAVLTDRDGLAGELFQTGNSDALAALVGRIVTRGPAYARERGRRRAHDFDWSRVAPLYLATYEQVATRRARGEHHQRGIA